MPLLEKEKTRQARMWVYRGDESHPYTVFDFTPSRARDGPMRFLRDFRGTLVADAYGGYDGIVAGNGITRAGCRAHARRKFVDAERTEPTVAREAVTLMDALFAVERSIREASPDVRGSVRAERSRPIVDAIESRLHRRRHELLPRHPMAGAVRYALNQWSALTVFLTDPEVPIDNNACEREMKASGPRPQELAVRRKPARRRDRGDPLEPHELMPTPRGGPAGLPDATAREPARNPGRRARPLAARRVKTPPRRIGLSHRGSRDGHVSSVRIRPLASRVPS
jgi:hypothetical protein